MVFISQIPSDKLTEALPPEDLYKAGLLLKNLNRSSHRGAVEMNPTRNHKVAGSIPVLAQWVKDLVLP